MQIVIETTDFEGIHRVGKLPGINVLRVPLGPVQKKLFFVLCKYIYHTLITILTAIVSLLPLSFCIIFGI